MPIGIPSGLGGTWLNSNATDPSAIGFSSPASSGGVSVANDPYSQALHHIREVYSLNGIDTGQNPTNNAWFDAAYEKLQKQYPQGTQSQVVPGLSASGQVTPPKPVTPAAGYTPSPQPTTGSNAFGYIPGQLGLPNPAGDLGAQIPGLQGLNAQASNTISSYLGGQIPVDVQKSIQDAAARFGVTSGMPGSNLVRNRTLRDFGLTSLDLSNKGLAAYNPFVSTVSQTQTLNPALQTQIAEQNAVNAAAPDPTLAASYAKQLYDQYLAQLSKGGLVRSPGTTGYGGFGGGYGPSGGTGVYAGGGPTNFLPHVSDNQSYTPGAFDFSNQFTGDSGFTPSYTPSYGVLSSNANTASDTGVPQFDNTFGLAPDTTGYSQTYPNYVMDWFGGGGGDASGGTGDFTNWFGE